MKKACFCGKVTMEFPEKPLLHFMCHCVDCDVVGHVGDVAHRFFESDHFFQVLLHVLIPLQFVVQIFQFHGIQFRKQTKKDSI